MDKRGFTLVELLAVIVLIGAILALSTIGVTRLIRNNEKKLIKGQCEELKEAAINYYNSQDNEIINITINKLISEGFFSDNKNVFSPASREKYIVVSRPQNSYDLEVDLSNISECD